jgi:hypothetical protein
MLLRLHGERHALGLVGAFLVLCCGPNVQLVYEGNVRFEHCYRLDLDPTIALSHRQACWKDYLARHTYAQSGDRIGYARQRLTDLENGKKGILTLDLDGGAAAAPRAETVPMPSSIHAAPPPRAPDPPAAPSQAPPRNRAEAPFESECTDNCIFRWNDCSASCETKENPTHDAPTVGKPPTRSSATSNQRIQKDECSDCKRAFKTCIQRCYR